MTNNNPWMLLYFISFLLIVSFFVLNMFVGVVVENFHKCRQHQEVEEARRREEKRQRRMEKKRRSKIQRTGRSWRVNVGYAGVGTELSAWSTVKIEGKIINKEKQKDEMENLTK